MKKRLVIAAVAVVVAAMLAYTAEQADTTTLKLRGTINAIEQMQSINDAIPESNMAMPMTQYAGIVLISIDSTEAN